jgi:alkanesulfonate monooxygenase SsuD/methylene tetrahydromethanopterin reductase-like flavin-dependent oxidoreductase (luciferase family)
MLEVIPRMMVEEPFRGCDGRFVTMPPRNVVPKPAQKPHPPLWVACSRRDTIHLAAEKAIGALTFSFIDASEARHWVSDYYATFENAVPAGFAANPNLAIVTNFMCDRDEDRAIERGIDGAHFFGYSLAHYYVFGEQRPGRTHIWDEFQQRREAFGFSREIVRADNAPLGATVMERGLRSLRGAIGTPEQVRQFLRGYEEIGVDQVILVSQSGKNRHEDICESLELFGREVLPEFIERDERAERDKARRMQPVIERAMARRRPAEVAADEDYRVRASMQV